MDVLNLRVAKSCLSRLGELLTGRGVWTQKIASIRDGHVATRDAPITSCCTESHRVVPVLVPSNHPVAFHSSVSCNNPIRTLLLQVQHLVFEVCIERCSSLIPLKLVLTGNVVELVQNIGVRIGVLAH